MDLAKQKRAVSTVSSRSIVTRSQTTAALPDFGKLTFAKRKAESPVKMLNKKSVVFRDLTNREVAKDSTYGKLQDDKITAATKKLAKAKISEQATKTSAQVASRTKVGKGFANKAEGAISSYFRLTKQATSVVQKDQKPKKAEVFKIKVENVQEKVLPIKILEPAKKPVPSGSENKPRTSKQGVQENQKELKVKSERFSGSSRDSDISPLYVTALEDLSSLTNDQSATEAKDDSPNLDPTIPPKRVLPPGVSDFDAENWTDPLQVSNYATDIFNYFKSVELKFQIKDYMNLQSDLTTGMRTVVVDWMVELQENFELNHETLYLAVKLLDFYLSKVQVRRNMLQLVAAGALFVASKYDERFPPSVDDYLYVCEGAYNKNQLMAMEINILKRIDFNLGFPCAYRFLRRYARFEKVSMPTLTLARYILEYSLMDYYFISESDSKLAAAAMLLALKMKGTHDWSPNLQYASGYTIKDLQETTSRLHAMLTRAANSANLHSIKNKYSHKLFFEVAKLPLLNKVEFD